MQKIELNPLYSLHVIHIIYRKISVLIMIIL